MTAFCLAMIVCAPCHASSPADLFWRIEADAMAEGGADVPGQISLHPQVERPTSMLSAGEGLVRARAAEYTPIRLSRGGEQLGRWDCSATSVELFLSLGADGDQGWMLGLGHSRSSDDVWYKDRADGSGNPDYGLGLDSRSKMASVAYRDRAGITLGAGRRWGTSSSVAGGRRLADALELPTDSDAWPSLETRFTDSVVAASWEVGEWGCGLQRRWSDPSSTMRLTRRQYRYTAPMEADGSATEGYLVWRRGPEAYFATLSNHSSRAEGTIYVGAVGRGDARLETRDRSLMLGWRRDQERRLRQFVIDRRSSEMATYEQGYAGILPGISSDIYTFRSSYDVSTLSARYAWREPLAGNWDVLASAAVHYSEIDGGVRVRRVRGFWSRPQTLTEYSIEDGIVRMLALALGIGYTDGNCSALLVCTGGLARASEIVTDPSDEPSDEPSLQLQPDLFVTLRFEYRF